MSHLTPESCPALISSGCLTSEAIAVAFGNVCQQGKVPSASSQHRLSSLPVHLRATEIIDSQVVLHPL